MAAIRIKNVPDNLRETLVQAAEAKVSPWRPIGWMR